MGVGLAGVGLRVWALAEVSESSALETEIRYKSEWHRAVGAGDGIQAREGTA